MKKERKTIMKTIKIFVIGHLTLVIGIAMLLLADAAWAVDFKNSYRGMEQKTSAPEYRMATTAPAMGFQSTSAYSGQWTTDQSSMLNADGSVNTEVYMSGPNRAKMDGPGGPGTPGGDLDPTTQQPLGDGLLVLMLCACAYLIVRATRKEEKIG